MTDSTQRAIGVVGYGEVGRILAQRGELMEMYA
jgi:phosphoglycerate dehydrogenase-like enzyme